MGFIHFPVSFLEMPAKVCVGYGPSLNARKRRGGDRFT